VSALEEGRIDRQPKVCRVDKDNSVPQPRGDPYILSLAVLQSREAKERKEEKSDYVDIAMSYGVQRCTSQGDLPSEGSGQSSHGQRH
jgi:hypothetical protein